MAQSAAQSDVEATLSRIQSHKGVLGTVIVSHQGTPLRSTLDDQLTKQYAELIPSLADLARNLVRDLDPQNDLEFLRIRSFKHEIMVAAKEEFVLIVIQDPASAVSQ
uniref:Dynein light chain roadblock n=1 Tax=Chlamydomonas leiostraca TaxID=1034604 RepID=A0A7S0S1S5_9CHLO|mmetsp:Transcript_38171/g.96601  ORF Transcript_38171/g.96601 Transcript_38171/m.96601 type:complete len:107 (+) Transcript_38171:115-435(+)|eukprot:CAMPEP_0202866776 /NCGR_PEP_ID=MMETSP1391-20130828/8357_1 /ASSEMBLY_ACC=CAM_ASM_000867 /TAXON_ID=1034604 /ORGANISM="Chlamydomonas leiostraca, Strain SAG 11-49" /LENGTH=106 /DNA_ID=CAMNT_0049546759 /DNA_START=114 /DNA_END=434 /DNA_ORIENTATION=+